MMHRLLFIVALSLTCELGGCSKPPLSDEQFFEKWREVESRQSISHQGAAWHFDFETVRLFRMNWDDQYSWQNIFEMGVLNETRLPVDGIGLTSAQLGQLEAAVTGTHADQGFGACLY
ncbi:hypothetical protein, partial [Rhodopirellula sp. SWK7]|uniref:hypothetical protein n=1 Tax=Rhodopirellula sp. SWK7 TaxID=595460 RepID=UPI0005C4ED40